MKGVIFTYLLTAFGCVSGIFWPVYGITAYFALSILKPRALWFWSVPYHRYAYWVAVCTLIGWLLDSFGRREHFGFMKLALLGMAGFVAWNWLSLFMTGHWEDVWLRYHCRKLTDDLAMVVVALTLISTFKQLRIFTYMVVLATGYLAYEMNYAWVIQRWNRLWIREFAGIDNNGMAMIFAMIVPVAFALGAYEKKWRMKLLAWAPIPLNIHAVEFSFSRTGMLGLFFSIPFLAFLMPRKLRTAFWMTLVLIGGLAMAGAEVRHRFTSIFLDRKERDTSANSRYYTWAAGWKCMKDHPVFGVGPRCFNRVSRRYGLAGGKSVHNLFIQVGADTGFPGVSMLIAIYAGTMFALLRHRKIRTQYCPWYPYWVAMIVSGLGTAVVCGQFIGMERVEMPYYLCAIGLSAVKVALIEQRSPALQMARASAHLPPAQQVPARALPAT